MVPAEDDFGLVCGCPEAYFLTETTVKLTTRLDKPLPVPSFVPGMSGTRPVQRVHTCVLFFFFFSPYFDVVELPWFPQSTNNCTQSK